MGRADILEAVSRQDTSELFNRDKELADGLLTALRQISSEFHQDILCLLNSVLDENDFSEVLAVITSLPPQLRIQLIAFVTTGDATADFMNRLDNDIKLQHVVDIAFAAHVGQLPDLESALDNAQEFLRRNEGGADDVDEIL